GAAPAIHLAVYRDDGYRTERHRPVGRGNHGVTATSPDTDAENRNARVSGRMLQAGAYDSGPKRPNLVIASLRESSAAFNGARRRLRSNFLPELAGTRWVAWASNYPTLVDSG